MRPRGLKLGFFSPSFFWCVPWRASMALPASEPLNQLWLRGAPTETPIPASRSVLACLN